MRMFIFAGAVLTLYCSAARAQNTWIVDGQGRPWSHFTTIQAAVNAAAPGDWIRVYASADYPEVIKITRGVHLVNVPDLIQRAVLRDITIAALPRAETVDVLGFTIRLLNVDRCDGAVVLDDLWLHNGYMTIKDSRLVAITGAAMGAADNPFEVTRSTLMMQSVRAGPLQVLNIYNNWHHVFRATDSRLHIIDSSIVGAPAQFYPWCGVHRDPGPAIDSIRSTITIGFQSRVEGGLSQFGFCYSRVADAVHSDGGSIWVDPNAVFGQHTGTATVRNGTVPAVGSSELVPGKPVVLHTIGEVGSWVGVFAAGPLSVPLPTPFGEIWLDPGSAILVDAGQVPIGNERVATFPVPTSLPQGEPVGFQAVELTPSGEIRTTLPTVALAR